MQHLAEPAALTIPAFAFLLGTYLPDALIAIVVICAAGLWTRWHRQARVALTASVILTVICLFTPLSTLLLRPLENRVARSDLNRTPAAVIVLVDELAPLAWTDRGAVAVSSSAGLLTEAAGWYTRRSDIKILLFITARSRSATAEADACLRFWREMGIPEEQAVVHIIPADVPDSAASIKELLKPDPDSQWVLISPAAHISKAKFLFERQGMRVLPWPTVYRTSGTEDDFNFGRLPQWTRNFSIVVREYVELWL